MYNMRTAIWSRENGVDDIPSPIGVEPGSRQQILSLYEKLMTEGKSACKLPPSSCSYIGWSAVTIG